jgi:hypothetical protein
MHDIDRSDLVFETDSFDDDELDEFDSGEDELPDEDEAMFDDADESELANELLSVSDDQELDHFLGGLISRGLKKLRPLGRALKNSGLQSQLGGLLKGAVKKVLPTVATMAGTAFGGPIGGLIAKNAEGYLSDMLGMELEGLSAEDQEFEAAKSLVRLAGNAIENAAKYANSTPAGQAARQAVIAAARQHIPGLVRTAGAPGRRRGGGAQQGTWYRRGNRIVIVGV